MNQSSRKHPKALYEGRWIFFILGFFWLLAMAMFPLLALPLGLLIIFCVYFFRDPERNIPTDPAIIVSPADGTVTAIDEVEGVEGDPYLTMRLRRISIFLSVFDVHVNRAPIAGELIHSEPRGGLYLDARKPESSLLNESRLWIIRGNLDFKSTDAANNCVVPVFASSSNHDTLSYCAPATPCSSEASATLKRGSSYLVGVKQITGAIARRIVPWSHVGDQLEKGERFGMIRFGSRTELYLPMETEVLVKVGDKVQGGSSQVAKWK